MLKVYVIFFVKAVKKNNHYSQSSFSKSYLGFLLRFGVFLKKVDGIVLFTELSVAVIFAVCFQ